MSLSPIKQGNDRIIWGTNGVYSEGIIIEDFDDEPGVEESTIPDNDGFTVAHIMIPDVHEFSFTMVCQSDVALPQTGDPLTIAGQACVCVKCSPKKKRKAEMTAKVTAKQYARISYAGGPASEPPGSAPTVSASERPWSSNVPLPSSSAPHSSHHSSAPQSSAPPHSSVPPRSSTPPHSSAPYSSAPPPSVTPDSITINATVGDTITQAISFANLSPTHSGYTNFHDGLTTISDGLNGTVEFRCDAPGSGSFSLSYWEGDASGRCAFLQVNWTINPPASSAPPQSSAPPAYWRLVQGATYPQINYGGTGYQVGDVLTPETPQWMTVSPAQFTVGAVDDNGAITQLSISDSGAFTNNYMDFSCPLDGGTGSGAQVSINYGDDWNYS